MRRVESCRRHWPGHYIPFVRALDEHGPVARRLQRVSRCHLAEEVPRRSRPPGPRARLREAAGIQQHRQKGGHQMRRFRSQQGSGGHCGEAPTRGS
eukprot:270202-Pyramimonas_sp.AAC.1